MHSILAICSDKICFSQELFGAEASDPMIAKLIWAVNLGFYVICNVLFVLAVIYAIAVILLLLFPHSLVKVYLTREMEEEGNPVNSLCCGCHCRGGNRCASLHCFVCAHNLT